MPPDRRLYPLKEACELLGGISRWTLAREEKDGRIRFTWIRGSKFVSHAEIERYLKVAGRKPREAA